MLNFRKNVYLGAILVILSMAFQAKGVEMKLNAGIITSKMSETKEFYVNKLGLKVRYENSFYLLLHTGGKTDTEIAFLLPNQPSQIDLFKSEYKSGGVFITIEVEDVDKVYAEIKSKNIPIVLEIKNENWGDRHFAIKDPNGIGVDFVTHTPVDESLE